MKQSTKKKAAALAKKWEARVLKGSSFKTLTDELKKDAKDVDAKVFTGWVRSVSGFETSSAIQFCSNAYTSYMSPWPPWAHELAVQSLLYGKKMTILCDGTPMGENLIQVILLDQNVQ